jgi:hypothetical protein
MPYPSKVEAEFLRSFETSDRGVTALGVFVQDQTTQPIDVWFTENQGTVTTANAVLQGGNQVDLLPGHGAVIGYVIEARTAENYVQSEIINVVGDTITVNIPWSRDFPAGVVLDLGNPDMNVPGTVLAPRIFSIQPSPLQKIDVTRIIFVIEDATAMDFSTFGGLAALTTGCVVRYKNSDGTFTNLFNWRTNGELIERSFDHTFQSKIGGGDFGFVARSTWAGSSKRGVAIRLDGANLEELEIVVQDDLTGLTKFKTISQGHVVQNG